MTTESLPQLRPLRLVELLDRAIRLYRRNFFKFVGIVAVMQIPITLFTLLSSLPTTIEVQVTNTLSYNESQLLATGGMCITAIITLVLVQGFATAALTRAVADNYLGQPISFVGAYRKISRVWLRLVGVMLLAGLISLALMLWFIIPCIGWVTGIGILLFFSQAITPLAVPIIVIEGQSGYPAIRRAWDLARRRFWWVVGFVAILYLFNQIVVGGPSFLIGILAVTLGDSLIETGGAVSAQTLQTIAQTLATMIANLLYLPLQLSCMTLLYFDLRIRTEGLDLALLADSTLREGTDVEALIAQSPPAESTGLVTWPELGNFALLSLGAAAIGLVFYLVFGGLMLAALGAALGASGGS
jgi:hypothetical protein